MENESETGLEPGCNKSFMTLVSMTFIKQEPRTLGRLRRRCTTLALDCVCFLVSIFCVLMYLFGAFSANVLFPFSLYIYVGGTQRMTAPLPRASCGQRVVFPYHWGQYFGACFWGSNRSTVTSSMYYSMESATSGGLLFPHTEEF